MHSILNQPNQPDYVHSELQADRVRSSGAETDLFHWSVPDCANLTKSITDGNDMDYYWLQEKLREEDWMDHCCIKHKQTTVYISYTGRRGARYRFLNIKLEEKSLGWRSMHMGADFD